MLFNLFGKKEDETNNIFKDKVYINSTGKMNACLQLAKEHSNALFIAWFTETENTFKAFFTKNGEAEKRIILAQFITPDLLQDRIPVFLEHHPLHTKEENFNGHMAAYQHVGF